MNCIFIGASKKQQWFRSWFRSGSSCLQVWLIRCMYGSHVFHVGFVYGSCSGLPACQFLFRCFFRSARSLRGAGNPTLGGPNLAGGSRTPHEDLACPGRCRTGWAVERGRATFSEGVLHACLAGHLQSIMWLIKQLCGALQCEIYEVCSTHTYMPVYPYMVISFRSRDAPSRIRSPPYT